MALLDRWYARRVTVTALLFLSLVFSAYMLVRVRLGPSGDTGPRAYAVDIEHFGVDAEEIERTITKPLEDAVSLIPGLTEIRSTSEYGKSRVTVSFEAGEPADDAYLSLRDAVERVYAMLPVSVQKPRIISSSEGGRPVFIASIRAGERGGENLREWVEKEVKPSFEKLPGAGEIEVGGGETREVHVTVDPRKASARGVAIMDVAMQLQKQNLLLPAGRLDDGGLELPVTFRGKMERIDQLADLDLELPGGGTVKLSDIAGVEYGAREKESISRVNGAEMIVLTVKSAGDANLIAFSRELRAETDRWRKAGFTFDVILDRGAVLEQGIYQIISSLLQGLAVVTVLLPLFVGEVRRLAALSLSVPLSAVITAALITMAGISFDQYILCGLAVGIGTIIDTGVIVGEQRSIREMREITPSLFSSLLTTLIVLAPLLFLEFISPGIRQVAFAIGLLLAVSFAVNIFFLPVFIHVGRAPVWIRALERLRARAGRLMKRRAYRFLYSLAAAAMRLRLPLLAFSLVLIGAGVMTILSVGTDFSSSVEDDSVYAHIELDPGVTVEATDERITRFAADLMGVPGVRLVETIARPGNGELDLRFSPAVVSRQTVTTLIKAYGERISGGFVYLPEGTARGERSMEIAVLGDDDEVCKDFARRTARELGARKWARQVVLNFKDPPQALIVEVDHQKAAEFGVSAFDIAGALRWAIHGPVALKWVEGDREMDLRVMESAAREATRESLLAFPIRNAQGAVRVLGGLAAVSTEVAGGKIFRKDRQRAAFLTIHAETRSLDDMVEKLWAVFREIPLPKGYSFALDRRVFDLSASFSVLWIALGASVAFIFLVLAVLSESVTAPLLILSILPTSLAFPLIAFGLLGEPLRVPVLVGLIMLSGMVVNNSILIVDEIRSRAPDRRIGHSAGGEWIEGAALRAIRKRIRPLLITSGATIMGSFPLLFAGARGGGFLAALAFVVFWGILGSLASTLLVIPALVRAAPGWLLKKGDAVAP